jgi:hypothetical protein
LQRVASGGTVRMLSQTTLRGVLLPKDFLGLLSRPANVLKALRRIALGGVIAAAGLPTAAGAAPPPNASAGAPAVSPTIVDRSKKAGKLVLRLAGGVASAMTPQHRSHRSHSSHSSHRSSSSGTTAPPVRTAPPVQTAPPASTASSLVGSSALLVTGEIETIDRVKRVIVVKQTSATTKSFAFRDDTRFELPSGIAVRFDEFSEANSGKLPIVVGDKVEVLWRTSTDGKTLIATTLKKSR